MTHFINYSPVTGLSIKTFRNTGAFNGDVVGLVDDIMDGREGCCELDGALDALEDGSLWSDEQQEVLEDLHALIRRWETEHDAEPVLDDE